MQSMTRPLINFNPDPTDAPGLPSYADVHAAMGKGGDRADHDLWAQLHSAWDSVAWAAGYSMDVRGRKQEAYEATARVLAAYRAGRAAVVAKPAPAPAKVARVLFDSTRTIRSRGFWDGELGEMTDAEFDRAADEAAFLDRYVRGCV